MLEMTFRQLCDLCGPANTNSLSKIGLSDRKAIFQIALLAETA
jgi:hypothetical protein